MTRVRKFRKVQHTKSKRGKEAVEHIQGGEYIHCECGACFIPIFENQTTCMKCRQKARYEECHGFAPKVVVV